MSGLGNLRKERTSVLKHREWRGFKDTVYDFYRWLVTWKDLIVFVMRSPIKNVKGIFRYRWMLSYLAAPDFIDRATAGARGFALRAAHLHYNAIVKKLTYYMAVSFKYDRHLSKNPPSSAKIVLVDELIPPQLMRGFPGLITIPAQAAPIFIASMVDQHITEHYLDAVEAFGVPADVCPLPSGEAGVAVEDDYPLFGGCFISCNMPCDGSVMTTSFQDRRFNLPTFCLNVPLRYGEEDVQDYAVQELRDCIAFVEAQTGEKFDWGAFKNCLEMFNNQNKYELEKWEMNRTALPQVTGATLWLYRLFYYQAAAGTDDWIVKLDKKVNRLMKKNYAAGKTGPKEVRHRCVIWSCPANYYTDLPVWMENTWGIVSLMDMETATSTAFIDTSSEDSMLAGLAKTYQRAVMRKHTKGGYAHVLDELWLVVEEFGADLVLMYDQISCKGMDGLHGVFEEQARQRGVRMMWVEQDLMDPTTISRRAMREQVNNYMYAVMKETPLDESLVDFDDILAW